MVAILTARDLGSGGQGAGSEQEVVLQRGMAGIARCGGAGGGRSYKGSC
jgi:hypothetical protein